MKNWTIRRRQFHVPSAASEPSIKECIFLHNFPTQTLVWEGSSERQQARGWAVFGFAETMGLTKPLYLRHLHKTRNASRVCLYSPIG